MPSLRREEKGSLSEMLELNKIYNSRPAGPEGEAPAGGEREEGVWQGNLLNLKGL